MSIAIRTYDDNKIRIVCNQNPYMTRTRGTNCKEIVRNHKAITPLNFLSENSDEKFSIDNYNRSRLVDLLKIVYDTSTGFDARKIDENEIKKIYGHIVENAPIDILYKDIYKIQYNEEYNTVIYVYNGNKSLFSEENVYKIGFSTLDKSSLDRRYMTDSYFNPVIHEEKFRYKMKKSDGKCVRIYEIFRGGRICEAMISCIFKKASFKKELFKNTYGSYLYDSNMYNHEEFVVDNLNKIDDLFDLMHIIYRKSVF